MPPWGSSQLSVSSSLFFFAASVLSGDGCASSPPACSRRSGGACTPEWRRLALPPSWSAPPQQPLLRLVVVHDHLHVVPRPEEQRVRVHYWCWCCCRHWGIEKVCVVWMRDNMNGGASGVCLNSKLFNLHHIILYFMTLYVHTIIKRLQIDFNTTSMSLNEYFVRNQSLTRPFLK